MKGVTVKIDNFAAVMKSIRGLTKNQVLVGFPGDTAERDDGSDLTNPQIAYIQENGAPEANIPARPFLLPGVEGAKDQIIKRYEVGARAVLNGRLPDIDDVHRAVGLETAVAVRRKIVDGPFQALSDRTLEARSRRGVTRTNPLIDTGALKDAVTYVIRPPSKG